MINRTIIDKGINDTIIRACELQHLVEHNYVITYSGFVCITNELWSKLMNSEENRKLVKGV